MKRDDLLKIRQGWRYAGLLALAICLTGFIGVAGALASCMNLDDVPLDTMEQAAPGIVMFVIDDSGSMDWEYICQGSTDGKFRGSIEYLFADPGDNVYSAGDGNGTILETYNNGQYANYYYSQWAGHNRLYYDPAQYYAPWPTYSDADPNNPRSNPSIAGNNLDLNGDYGNLGGAGSGVSTQDILDNGGVIVDNSEQVVGEGLIIDNSGPESPATGSFDTSGSGYYAWSSASATSDNGSNYLYSNNSNRWAQANWRYTNLDAGDYDVFVWYVASSNRGTSVSYYVYNAGGAQVASNNFNQQSNGGQWNLLAADVYLDGSATITLRHWLTSSSSNRACADAVMLVPKFGGGSSEYTEVGTWSESGAGDEYENSSVFSSQNGAYATWTPYLPDAGDYIVYVWYTNNYGGYDRDDHALYTVHSSGGDTDFRIDQDEDGGQWVELGEFYFDAGTSGYVRLTHDDMSNGNTSADAVAFMPAVDIEPLNLIRAHYYVKVNDTFYLVNLDGDFKYYQVDDTNSNGNIDSTSELIYLTAGDAAAAGIVPPNQSYAEARQNFANWYSFYRKRELTAKNAIAKVIDEMQGVYIGMHFINNGTLASYAKPVKVTLNDVLYDNSDELLQRLYDEQIASNSTPLRNGLRSAGRYFMGDFGVPGSFPAGSFSSSSYPYFTQDRGGSCQQSFTILMTDGYYNGSSPADVGNDDGDNNTDFDGPPYGDGVTDTLADVAMYYYERDLNGSLNDDVPINNVDLADHQHMVTYTLSFGVQGTIDQTLYPNCINGGQCPYPWPNPNDGNEEKIDDMYHAAVNGRGKYVDAASPQEMVDAMNELKNDIESRLGSSAALATNSIQRQVGSVIYQGTYNTAGWVGEIAALPVNLGSGTVGTPDDPGGWRASDGVPAWDQRNIISFNGTSSIDFRYDSLTTLQQALLGNNGHNVQHLVDYLRGRPASDFLPASVFRVRTSPIGDIVHSAPTYYKGVVYIGANDGMLHAVNAINGQEIFCYVPNMVYGHLSDLAVPGYSHKYYVDSTPVAAKIGSQDILVCGLGKGGKGYFGLDITTPSEPSVLWEYTNDDDLGYSFSQANIIRTQGADHVVMFGNGYDSVSETAAIFFLNPLTGDLVKKIDTGATGCNGLATPSAVDVDADGHADFAYAGDLYGNMWKFDLRGDVADWKVYYNSGSPQPLISVRNTDGNIQPITAAPEVMLDCAKSDFSRSGNGMMVIFGTGRYLNSDDFDNIEIQSFYGVWDWGDVWEQKNDYATAKEQFLGEVGSGRSLSNVAASLLEQTTSTVAGEWVLISGNPVNWYDPEENTGEHMGWVFDMTTAVGERGVREPNLSQGVVELISIIPSDSPCEAGGSSMLYRVSACSGGYTDDPQFDVNDDRKVDDADRMFDASSLFDPSVDYNNDGVVDDEDLKAFLGYRDWNDDGVIDSADLAYMQLPPSGKAFEQMLFEGIDIGNQRYFSDTEGNINSLLGPPVNLGLFYWRVIQ